MEPKFQMDMSSPLQDRQKFTFYRLSDSEKGLVRRKLIKALKSREEILVVIIYGSFISSPIFRDIDIGILTGGKISYKELLEYEDILSEELSHIVGLPVDVRVIDYAPLWFRAKVLRGEVLLERSSGMVPILRFLVNQIREISKR